MEKNPDQLDPKKVTHRDFEKLELRVATIKGAKLHENGQDYVLALDLGPVELDIQVVVDLKESYNLEELIGKQVIVLLNIRPEKVGEIESQAMLLITTKDGKPVLLSPEKAVYPGVQIVGIMNSTCIHFEPLGDSLK